MQEQKTFRVNTEINKDTVINVKLQQTFDTIDVLSLKLTQKNAYKLYDCGYGVVIGRVLANEGFGVPNAKISIFVPMEDSEDGRRLQTLYNFSKTSDRGENGYMYNLLPDFVDKACHQDIGTFYNKRYVLDNDDVIDVFDKYYKYTTTTNQSGDYIIYGVPTGNQLLHVDVDLSDIGILSQTPRDMMYKGYTADLFESPTKFKWDSNLNSLPQIKRQTKSIFVEPFWGDTSDGNKINASIVRCDINLDYKFESTCVFMGSVITDNGEESINKNCRTTKNAGKMSELTTGPGMIEMIRYNERGKIEQATVKGEKLIDDNGVWCYQIPMNLDYVKTDEFGKMVPSDDPNKGIATRAKVRFRISMDDVGGEGVARKRARYLVPNNPEIYPSTTPVNYDNFAFGSATGEQDFRNLYWNCVYTVKSYIPRLQKTKNSMDKRFTGIKAINRSGDNNPMPYNSLSGKMNFNYVMLCILLKIVVNIVFSVNVILSLIAKPAYDMYEAMRKTASFLWGTMLFKPISKIFCKCKNALDEEDDTEGGEDDVDKKCHKCEENEEPTGGLCWIFYKIYDAIGCGVGLSGLCDDGVTYYPGCIKGLFTHFSSEDKHKNSSNSVSELFNCFESRLAEDNEVMSFNFSNDWINGVLYFPLWFRYIKQKRVFLFDWIQIQAKDKWCNSDKNKKLKLYKTCSLEKNITSNNTVDVISPYDKEYLPDAITDIRYELPNNDDVVIGYNIFGFKKNNCYGFKCIKTAASCVNGLPGFIKQKLSIQSEANSAYVYYYSPGVEMALKPEPDSGDMEKITQYVKMFSTDIVLLGSLHDCDLQGIPQFFKDLGSTTYNMPPDLVLNDGDEDETYAAEDSENQDSGDNFVPGTEYTFQTGADWGKRGYRQCYGPGTNNQGEPSEYASNGGLFYGITCSHIYTKPKTCVNLERICEYGVSPDLSVPVYKQNGQDWLIADGYISYDDLNDNDGRTNFAAMNSNHLMTRINPDTGFEVYDFDPIYLDNFDGTLNKLMQQSNCAGISYYYNYTLENNNEGYSNFRYGKQIKILGFSSGRHDAQTNIMVNGNRLQFNKGFVSTLNSFYFYFGLKFGKTAIDRLFIDYFSKCDTDESEHIKIGIDSKANPVCGAQNGYMALDLTGILCPYSIELTASNNSQNDVFVDNINDERVYFGTYTGTGYSQLVDPVTSIPIYLNNDYFHVKITDADGYAEELDVNLVGPQITTNVNPTIFAQTNNELYLANPTPTYNTIASQSSRFNDSTGGYITFDIPRNSETTYPIQFFELKLEANNTSDFPQNHGTITGDVYSGCTFSYQGLWPQNSQIFYHDNSMFVIGVPKGDVEYKITITELCYDSETQVYSTTNNIFQTIVKVNEGTPLKMLVNNIDYEIIKNFSHNAQILNCQGWLNMSDYGIGINELQTDATSLLSYQGIILKGYASDISKYAYQLTCNYNWPDDCLYVMTNFIPGSVEMDTLPSNPPTQNDPDYIYYTNSSSFYEKTVSNYQPVDINVYYSGLTLDDRFYLVNGINEIITKRKDLTKRVRSAFYTRNDNGNIYDMAIGYSGGVPLIKHCISYIPEDENGVPTTTTYTNEFTTNYVSDQYSPTIYVNNNNVPSFYVKNGKTKKPYIFGVNDSVQQNPSAVPIGCNVNNPTFSGGFYAHMLYKGMDAEYEIWAPTTGMPNFFNPTSDNQIFSVEGIFGLRLMNGISTSSTNVPEFETCVIEDGNNASVNLLTVVPSGYTVNNIESRPKTKRVIAETNSSTNVIIWHTIEQDPQVSPYRQCHNIYRTLPSTTKFVCSDGRETVNVNLYPQFELIFDSDESEISSSSNTPPYSSKVELSINPIGGYTPNAIYGYDINRPNFEYPFKNLPINSTSNTILRWDYYANLTDDNNSNYDFIFTHDLNTGRFTHQANSVNPDSIFYALSVSGSQNNIKRMYGISGIIDCSLYKVQTPITYNASTDNSIIVIALTNINGNGNFAKKHDFVIIGKLNSTLKYEEYITIGIKAILNGNQITITASGDWRTSNVNNIWIKDKLGIRHKIIPF